MDFFLAMSIFGSAADIARENANAQEWIRRAWVARDVDGKGGAATERDERQQRAQQVTGAQGKKLQRRLWFAPEFDGLNCFETIVDKRGAAVKQGEQQLLQDMQRAQQLSRTQGKKLQGSLWFAPEFDGINCFETIVEQGERLQLRDEQQAQQVRAARVKRLQGRLWFVPEFDGLNCFETIVSR